MNQYDVVLFNYLLSYQWYCYWWCNLALFLGKVLVRDERFKERKITGHARIYYEDNVLFCW